MKRTEPASWYVMAPLLLGIGAICLLICWGVLGLATGSVRW